MTTKQEESSIENSDQVSKKPKTSKDTKGQAESQTLLSSRLKELEKQYSILNQLYNVHIKTHLVGSEEKRITILEEALFLVCEHSGAINVLKDFLKTGKLPKHIQSNRDIMNKAHANQKSKQETYDKLNKKEDANG